MATDSQHSRLHGILRVAVSGSSMVVAGGQLSQGTLPHLNIACHAHSWHHPDSNSSVPEHLGATWALAISAIVQLSSGWTPVEDRLLTPAPDASQTAPVLAQVRHPVVASPVAQKA